MQIRFYANLRSIPDNPILELTETEIHTLRQLFEYLIKIYPKIGPHLVDDRGDLRSDVPIFVNGRNPRLADAGLDISLEREDVISLFSPISSGRMNVEVIRSQVSDEQE